MVRAHPGSLVHLGVKLFTLESQTCCKNGVIADAKHFRLHRRAYCAELRGCRCVNAHSAVSSLSC